MTDAIKTVDLTQTQTAAADAGETERMLRINSRAWPLVQKINLRASADLNAAANSGDIYGIIDAVTRMATPEHREEIHEYVLQDLDADHEDFVDEAKLVEAFQAAQKLFRS